MKCPLQMAVYCRTSTLDQKNKQTIEAQIEPNANGIQRYLRKNGGQYELFSRSPLKKQKDLRKVFFCDDGYNLEDFDPNTALHELLELIKNEQIEAIYCDSENRRFRSQNKVLRAQIMQLLEHYDVRVFNHMGEIPQGILLEMVNAIGASDKHEITRKMHLGKIQKIRTTDCPLNARDPFGYRWLKARERYEIVEEEAKVRVGETRV